jgi:type II secretory pathway pseudopilin PulG
MVVITIIAILAGLLITLIPEVMRKAKLADTSSRMNSVHTGMALIGQNEGSATFRMQQMLEYRTTGTVLDGLEPGLSGIFTFGPPNSNATGADVGLPTVGTRPSLLAVPPPDPYGAWGYRGRGHLAFPWGKKFPDPTPVTGTQTTVLMGPERFMLRHMSPFNTRKLLKLANILPTKVSSTTVDNTTWPEKQYMTNRKTSEQWNDAWGHPLVVASVLYQPTFQSGPSLSSLPGWKDGAWPTMTGTTPVDPVTATVTASSTYLPAADASTWSATQKSTPPTADDEMSKQAPTKKMLLDHMKLYQYNRSVYIAVAAVGPSARASDVLLKSATATDWGTIPTTTPISGTLDILWNQANNVCQQAKKAPFDSDWTELSWDNPPWQGNKYDYLTSSKKLSDANYIDTATRALIYEGVAPYKGKEEHCVLSAPLEYK